ncbi:MAG: DUF2089 domain-containing protein [Candidatus Cloacimonetes bacterium]|nr:DUF2089 domain-containing protein [Candidatus Cloacimonadota bacterium]
MKKDSLNSCPVCNSELRIQRYACPNCNTSIEGDFKLSGLAALKGEQLEFAKIFLLAEGNIKEVERVLNISYPTVKARLREITKALQPEKRDDNILSILEGIEDGEISIDDAISQIEKRR